MSLAPSSRQQVVSFRQRRLWITASSILAGIAVLAGAPDATATSPAPSAPTPAPSERKPQVAVTRHVGEFNGRKVAYTATVQENFLDGPDGRPNASLVTIAYVRDNVVAPSRRPVIFAFNGGPGASSSPLHMDGIGPCIRSGEIIRNNPYSLLDVADLVFIDPVGAGFSRNFTTAAGPQYWSRTGDAKSVAEVIGRWLKANRREASPRFLVGESYGTVRNAYILKDYQKRLHFNGVVQVSMTGKGFGTDGDDGRVSDFPTMATTAWYWKKAGRTQTLADTFETAAKFAGTELAPALALGAALPESAKQTLARRMSEMIGVPAGVIVEKNLRLSKDDFMFRVIADQGLRTGQLDTRVSAPIEGATRGAYGDPTMFKPGGLKVDGSGLIGADEANAPLETDRAVTPLERYFRETLGFKPPLRRYRPVNFDVNLAWASDDSRDPNVIVAQAMRDDPNLRLIWTAGYYDLSAPAYGARLAIRQAGAPVKRTHEILLPGPHSVFEGDEDKAVLSKALRNFVSGSH